MNSSSQAAAIQTALDPSEVTPTLTEWRVSHYFADDVETYGESWTAEAAEEEAYYCQPLSVVCHKCWYYEHGTHASLDDAGWTLCKAGELCPDCTQEQINKGNRPEDYWGPVVFTDLPF